ncbi:clathrin light chain isoform X2 [Agrilus planipennis]|uniref:Clathrin light chain n=1 Tax=Agrilus planipennis TaxID=224129 RepID=A0A7F5RFH3_AGRPL|nr:clathrin light chain isoform X2 [Agrilus planipennis]
MSEFGDNFEIDPAAEFLAREQSELAGLEDEVKPAAVFVPGFTAEEPTTNSLKEHSESFEMINGVDHDNVEIPKEEFSEVKEDFNGTKAKEDLNVTRTREEPEKIKKWREEQQKRLEEKDKEEELKKEEWRAIAKKELEDWYKNHEELIAKTKAANRNAEKLFVAEDDQMEPGTEWERIAKLCDFSPKVSKSSKDVSRMRSIILQLKQSGVPIKQNAK